MLTHRDLDGTWARLVTVDGIGTVLEMRDPNSGQGWDVRAKPRHQYVRAGGRLWTRCLPPETLGDAWIDIGVPPWEPTLTPGLPGLLDAYADAAPDLPLAALAGRF